MPATRAQKGAPMPRMGMAATVTRKVTKAPKAKRPWKATANADCSTRSIARPAKVAMKAGGVESMRRVTRGARRPKPTPRRPMTTPAVYWPWRSPVAEMMALTGPVRQVGTAPTKAETMLEARIRPRSGRRGACGRRR